MKVEMCIQGSTEVAPQKSKNYKTNPSFEELWFLQATQG
jgi:hypothetical protein